MGEGPQKLLLRFSLKIIDIIIKKCAHNFNENDKSCKVIRRIYEN